MINMSELRAEINALVSTYNTHMGDSKVKEAAEVEKQYNEKLKEYNSECRRLFYTDCQKTSNPILTAVTKYTFPSIKVVEEKTDDTIIPIRRVIDVERTVNLFDMRTYFKDKQDKAIGVDPSWFYKLQKVNFLMTCRSAMEHISDPKAQTEKLDQINKFYRMDKDAREIELAINFDPSTGKKKPKNPTSTKSLIEALQEIVDGMVGPGYHVGSAHVRYMVSVYHKDGKGMQIVCPTHRYFGGFLTKACHSIVTGKSFDVTSREIRIPKDGSKDTEAPAAPAPQESAPIVAPVAAE